MAPIRKHKALVAILVLAAGLRLFGLESNPNGFFRDEADKGYSTYSLLLTGKDLAGRSWPLQIKSFNAYTSPLYHWFSIPIIYTLGLSIFSTRLLAALAGTTACFGVYLVGKEWNGTKTALWTSLLLAVSPWHLLFSRWANQGILMTVFVPLAVWTTWKTLRQVDSRNGSFWRWGVAASVCWALAWIAYAPARLFVPLFMVVIFVAEVLAAGPGWKERMRPLVCVGCGALLLVSPFVLDILFHWEETQTRLRFLTGGEGFHVAQFIQGYLLHWDPRYLCWTGDGNLRHHFYVFGQGQMSVLETCSCLIGLGTLVFSKARYRGWLLAWLLLSPVPAAITREGLPHALRTLMVVPALALLGGVGIEKFDSIVARCRLGRVGPWLIGTLFLLETVVSLGFFWLDYPLRSGLYWEEGTVEAFRTVEKKRGNKEACVVTGMIEYPESFALFVAKPDPSIIQQGRTIPGYHFLPTGHRFDPEADDREGLLLLRSWEIRRAPWWRQVSPDPGEEKMLKFWRLYRSRGTPLKK